MMKYILGICAMLAIISTMLNGWATSHNQAYATVEAAKQRTEQTSIEWGARVSIADIEAHRDVDVATIERDGQVWSSWAWNVGRIIRVLLWVAGALFLLLIVIWVFKRMESQELI
jgi:hypothetical protein